MAEKCPYCGGEMEDWKFQGRREHGMVLLPRDYQAPAAVPLVGHREARNSAG